MTLDEALALSASPVWYGPDHPIRVLAAEVARLRKRESTLQANVMAHKMWENEAVAQAGNANRALNKIRTENAAMRLNLTSMQKFTDEIKAENAALAALRQRHAEAVKLAYYEAFDDASEFYRSLDAIAGDVDAQWLRSSAKKGLEGA